MLVPKSWRKAEDRVLEGGCLLSFLLSLFILGTPYNMPFWIRLVLFLGINAVIYLVGRSLHHKYATTIEKIFGVENRQASQIVENVLNDKQLPFTKKRQGEMDEAYSPKGL